MGICKISNCPDNRVAEEVQSFHTFSVGIKRLFCINVHLPPSTNKVYTVTLEITTLILRQDGDLMHKIKS